jgi:hypothetical protein
VTYQTPMKNSVFSFNFAFFSCVDLKNHFRFLRINHLMKRKMMVVVIGREDVSFE